MGIQRRIRHVLCSVGSSKGAKWVIPHFLSTTSNGGWLGEDSSSFSPKERIRTGSCPLPVKANTPKMRGGERKDSAESFFTGGGKD